MRLCPMAKTVFSHSAIISLQTELNQKVNHANLESQEAKGEPTVGSVIFSTGAMTL